MTPRSVRRISLALALAVAVPLRALEPLPSARQMADSLTDIWAEAAIREPGGPSYEFFKDLLPPLRYVNTAFRHYPIVLCAPLAPIKARYVSNGSAINARADKKPMWKEAGFPVHFRVGDPGEPFGDDLARLDGPRYAEGYLPLVHSKYTQQKTVYEQIAFAPVKGVLAEHGAVLVRFSVRGERGVVSARLFVDGLVKAVERSVADAKGQGLLLFGAGWKWDDEKKELRAAIEPGGSAVLCVLTKPLPPPLPAVSDEVFKVEEAKCRVAWQTLLDRGTKLDIPEPVVQNAWRSLIIGNYLLAVGDRMHYSAGNAYDHLYEAECGDAVRALMLYGHPAEAQRMLGPLLDFNRKATQYHVAGHKLQLLAHYSFVTRDAKYLREKEAVWKPVIDFIISSRQKANGLLPKDNYAGDISQQVWSLNSNANAWRGLRDMAAVLDDLGERDRARELAREAAAFRQAILDAVAKSERRDVKPPFIPNALLGDEPAHEVLTATRMGSYYDLMAPYIIGSGVYRTGSERETWMIDYLRQHGGVAMGMIRSTPHQGEFDGEPGVNVLYGLRYQLALLRRDDREHTLAGFYAHLAQGMTRDTFIGGEGSRFFHGDRLGRSFYLPPNSAANATFLTTLRYLLIQDWEDDAGKPDTLRLLYGVPGRWFADGTTLRMEGAPTLFGPMSMKVESRLKQGEVVVTIDPPPRRPNKWLLRLPLRTVSARIGDKEVMIGKDGEVELAYQNERFVVRFRVKGGGR